MRRIISPGIPARKLTEMNRRSTRGRRSFKSKHLLGRFKSSGSSNARVRAVLKKAADEKNR